jgi:hypothetical protein
MAAARLPMILAADRPLAAMAGAAPHPPTPGDRVAAFARGLAALPGHAARVAAFPLRRLWRALAGGGR